MKTPALIVLALAFLVGVVALPAGPRGPTGPSESPDDGSPGVLLAQNTDSGITRRILVEAGPQTVLDRGTLAELAPRQALEGTFRFWEETSGPVLYVYDDVQNLTGRIVNPAAVRLLD